MARITVCERCRSAHWSSGEENELLDAIVTDFEVSGSHRVDRSLGIQKMPDGYALMLDGDEMYFYWLREDGAQSEIHWNKWAVRRGAMLDLFRRGEHAQA